MYPLWAMMEKAGVALTLYIESGVTMPSEHMNTGEAPELKGNLFNIESTKAHYIPVLHHAIERWLTCMIYHGVLERFPRLKAGLIELGVNCVVLTIKWHVLPTYALNLSLPTYVLNSARFLLSHSTAKFW